MQVFADPKCGNICGEVHKCVALVAALKPDDIYRHKLIDQHDMVSLHCRAKKNNGAVEEKIVFPHLKSMGK